MRVDFIEAERVCFPFGCMCQQMCVSRSGCYACRERPESAREKADRVLAQKVVAIHRETRCTYGSPRVLAELLARGRQMSCKRVACRMGQQGLRALKKRRFVRTTDSRHNQHVAPNVLERNFSPGQPNSTWATDIIYVWTRQGWLYLAVLLDRYSRCVVGWTMSDNIDQHLVLSAIDMALQGRQPPLGLPHHSDRGRQYASYDYQKALETRGMRHEASSEA